MASFPKPPPAGHSWQRSVVSVLMAAALCASAAGMPLTARAVEEAEYTEPEVIQYEELTAPAPDYTDPAAEAVPVEAPAEPAEALSAPAAENVEEATPSDAAGTEETDPAGETDTAPPETQEPTEIHEDESSETDPAAEPAETRDTEPDETASDEPAEAEAEDPLKVSAEDVDAELEESTEKDDKVIQGGDPSADVESLAYMESTIPFDKLTGDRVEDLLTVAASQLGYTESTRNYIINSAGKTKGYTRYGAWYGDSYGDWCAMYVCFCLYYAGIPAEEFPRSAGCPDWSVTLQSRGQWAYADYEDVSRGDIIFFDRNYNRISDHVGIVYDVYQTEDGSWWIDTIEGNSSNRVQIVTYPRDYAGFYGFGLLPIPETEPESPEEGPALAYAEGHTAEVASDFTVSDVVGGLLQPRGLTELTLSVDTPLLPELTLLPEELIVPEESQEAGTPVLLTAAVSHEGGGIAPAIPLTPAEETPIASAASREGGGLAPTASP